MDQDREAVYVHTPIAEEMMSGGNIAVLFVFTAIILGPPLLLAAIMKKLGRGRLWAVLLGALWLVLLVGFCAWFVWSYDRW